MRRHAECARICRFAEALGAATSMCVGVCQYEAVFGVENDPSVGPEGAPPWFETTLGDAD